jgi:hypothetical protein
MFLLQMFSMSALQVIVEFMFCRYGVEIKS